MNTNTGAIYTIGDDFAATLPQPTFDGSRFVPSTDLIGDRIEELQRDREEQLGRKLAVDEVAALADVAGGDPIVPVGPRVVQQMELGRRELERRHRRREQQRKGRSRL